MTRMVDIPDFTIPNGTAVSNEISTLLRDTIEFQITPPATLPEADIQLQFWNGAQWVYYDATNFVAGVDNYELFLPRGLKYRLSKRAGVVAADRVFPVTKRVAGDG